MNDMVTDFRYKGLLRLLYKLGIESVSDRYFWIEYMEDQAESMNAYFADRFEQDIIGE
jgi:hypothetical protein